MNEKGLINKICYLMNKNYSDIYVIDIKDDLVYVFDYERELEVTNKISYSDFYNLMSSKIHKKDLKKYFDAINLTKVKDSIVKGNSEIKVKYRKLCAAGNYRYYVNIINYLNYDNRDLLFIMSEDINDRLIDLEEDNKRLQEEILSYKTRLNSEESSISDALYQVDNLLQNSSTTSSGINSKNIKEYINNIFSNVSINHPSLNKAITEKTISSTNYNKPSILIIDDSLVIRNSLKRIFEDNFKIIMSSSGNNGIEIIKKNILNASRNDTHENIVCILLDLIMTDGDGFKVLDFLKTNNLLSKIPVAIISGDESRETRKRVYKYDIVDMLEKPFNNEMIKKRITKIINLYVSANDLTSLVAIKSADINSNNKLNEIVCEIVKNIINSKESNNLKKIVRVLSSEVKRECPSYNLSYNDIENITNYSPLYNIGAIALPNNIDITASSIKKEIEYGKIIASIYIKNKSDLELVNNIIEYSCELSDGSGYPNKLKGYDIPIEASITNMAVRILNTHNPQKILNEYQDKYPTELINSLKNVLNDIESII